MRNSFSALTQSKFFTPSFNSAIFDGPMRIYFSQFHESYALKVYFKVQDQLQAELQMAKDYSKKSGLNVLVLIYPSQENFEYSFEPHQRQGELGVDMLGEDTMIGLSGPLTDESLDSVVAQVRQAFKNWSLREIPETHISITEASM